jgi:predicted HAD superfamily Cof-like phosphohydrolase
MLGSVKELISFMNISGPPKSGKPLWSYGMIDPDYIFDDKAKLIRTPSAMVREFHKAYGLPVRTEPLVPNTKEIFLRVNLLQEEFEEYLEAVNEDDLVGIADALADMIYIIHGTALVYGLPLDEVFSEVHRSNMSKLDENGKPIYREDGKVLKGNSYSPPNIKEILDGKTGKYS